MRLVVAVVAVLFLSGQAAPSSSAKGKAASEARKPVTLSSEKAKELKAAYEAALKANQVFQLAQKEWEAKYNAWVAAEYKARYELGVPQDFVLNLDTAAFEPKEKSSPVNPGAPIDKKD